MSVADDLLEKRPMQKTWLIAILICGCALAFGRVAPAQTFAAPAADAEKDEAAKPEVKPPAGADGGLAAHQEQVAERFRELERLLLRMAELTAPTDPRRAALLRQAVAQSKQRDIDHQFEQLVELLRQERLAVVVKNQGEVQQDLAKLLELLLSEDRTKRIESEKERIREYLKRVNKIIKEQKGIQGETARGGDPRKLADQQGDLSEKTGKLARDLDEDPTKKAPTQDSDKENPKGDPQKGDKPDGKDQGKGGSDPKKSDTPKQGDKPDDGKEQSQDKPPGDKPEGDQPQGQKDDHEKKDQKKQDQQDQGKQDKDKQDQQGDDKPQKDNKDQQGKPGGQPQDQQPGADDVPPSEPSAQNDTPAQKRVEQAQQRMKEAQRKLEEAKRSDATEKQAEAIKELEQAKADLEEILRQLREEEMARTLAMLESRFRKMLDQQVEVFEGTKRLDKVPPADRNRDDEIEAGRMSVKEKQIVTEADKALEVLREEGSAVAFPEAVTEMRDDMETVAKRLAQSKVGEVTQGIEKDVIAALEEMIAALQKAQKDMENKDKQGEPAEGGDNEPPLVDTLSELKMIRALQMRVNVRTQRYAVMTKTEQTDTPELLEALKRLAEREQRIHKVTRDIVLGRNR